MTTLRVQMRFQGASELPEDVLTNTFHFSGGPGDTANALDMVEDFYTVASGGGAIVGEYCSDVFSGDYEILAYDMADPEPRVPVDTRAGSFTPAGGNSLPAEVALCCSFQADPLSGTSQARRRGRVFLGPFLATDSTDGRPNSALRTLVAASASDFIAASDASLTWNWVVYSPTADAVAVVRNGWVDDAWDTIRSRGPRPTTRTLFS